MSLQGVTLHLSGGQLSDLFFNYEHPERDKIYNEDVKENSKVVKLHNDFSERVDEALLKDAKEFCLVIGVLPEEFAEALVKDFNRRV